VATKTSPPRRRASRKPPAKRSSRTKKARTRFRTVLSPWARDGFGIGLVVFGLLSVLSLWLDAAGPAGHGISWFLRSALGIGAYAFPVVGVYWGVVLLRDMAPDDRVRMFIGFVALSLGVLGLVSLLGGNPGLLDTRSAMVDAGGIAGAVAAHPLSRVLSPAGSGIVDAGLAVLGLLVFTGTPVSVVTEKVRDLREGWAERDPVGAEREEPAERPSRLPRRRLVFGALGLDAEEEVVMLPEAEPMPHGDGPDAMAADTTGSGRKPRGRTVTTSTGPYHLPPLDLLRAAPPSTSDGRDEDQVMEALERTLHTFAVDARVTASHRGPTVTMYEVDIAAGTKVNKVLALSSDIAYALATPDVRIIAPIPGKSAIGVEVPNKHRDFVMLGDILRSRAARDVSHPLTVALGKDVHGRAQMVNLAMMPHALIAGATGAGKSSLINCFITSLLMRTTPDDVRMVSRTSRRCPTCCRRSSSTRSALPRRCNGSSARWSSATRCWRRSGPATSTGTRPA
jgi:DNA segregation ATPase FtsK/SpoIIIE, S-DNA-T family